MTPRRDDIWITGIGCATSLGLDFAALADNIIAGRSGIGPIRHFDASQHVSRIASALPKIPTPPGYSSDDFARRDPSLQLLLWCGLGALRDAGLTDQRRIGLVVGIGAEGMQHWERDSNAGGDSIRHPETDGPGLVGNLRSILQLTGPSTTVAAACASGNVAFGVARQWIEMGLVDIVLAGGGDRGASPMGVAGFGNLGALSTRNDQPTQASRPFDRDRDGFVVGEGGGASRSRIRQPRPQARRPPLWPHPRLRRPQRRLSPRYAEQRPDARRRRGFGRAPRRRAEPRRHRLHQRPRHQHSRGRHVRD